MKKKILSIALALIFLFSYALPATYLYADVKVKKQKLGVTTIRTATGSGTTINLNRTSQDIGGLVAREKPDVYILYDSSGHENSKGYIIKDGNLVANPPVIRKDQVFEIFYKWSIPAEKMPLGDKDFFEFKIPKFDLIFPFNFDPNLKYAIKGSDGSEDLGSFTVDGTNGVLRAELNANGAGKKGIKEGFFKFQFSAKEALNITPGPGGQEDIQVISAGPILDPKGINEMYAIPFYKYGAQVNRKGKAQIKWGLEVNRDQHKKIVEGQAPKFRENVWLEDHLASNMVVDEFELVSGMFIMTPGQKMSNDAFAWAYKGIDASSILGPHAGETYDDFKARLKASGPAPLTVGLYPAANGEGQKVIAYLGTPGQDLTYDKLVDEAAALYNLSDLLAKGQISQEQFDQTKEAYGIDGNPATPMKPVMEYLFNFFTSQAQSGKYVNRATMEWDGGSTENTTSVTYSETSGGASFDDVTSILVQKKWVGKTEPRLEVKLLADGQPYLAKDGQEVVVELNPSQNWVHVFSDLPKFKKDLNGKPVEVFYDVEEVNVPAGYKKTKETNADRSQITLTNTYQSIDLKVTKQWVGPAGPSATLILYGQDQGQAKEVKDRVTLQGPNWTHTFTNLPKYDGKGHKIIYSVDEADMAGYSKQIKGDAQKGFTIINTNDQVINIDVSKVWMGPAAGPITVDLYDGKTRVGQASISEGDQWKHTFTGLRKYNAQNGSLIDYSLKEQPVAGYNTTYSGDAATGFTITNTLTGKISVGVTKQWVGPAGPSATIILYGQGQGQAKVEKDRVTLQGPNWTHTFTNLPEYDGKGQKVIYSVDEEDMAGYSKQIKGDIQKGFTITNTNMSQIEVSVTKKWLGQVGEEITLDLFADGVLQANRTIVLTKGQYGQGDWQYRFRYLPKYSPVTGQEIVYHVDEQALSQYHKQVDGDMVQGFTITNTLIPPTGPSTPYTPYTPNEGDGTRPSHPRPVNPTPPTTPTSPTTPTDPSPLPPTVEIPENRLPEGSTSQGPEDKDKKVGADNVVNTSPQLPKTGGIPRGILVIMGGLVAGWGLYLKRK